MNYLIGKTIPLRYQFTLDEVGIEGQTVSLKIQRQSDSYFYDFSDDTFKASPVQDTQTMTDETDGYYSYNFDTASFNKDIYLSIITHTYETQLYTKKFTDQTLDPDDMKADVSALALESSVQQAITDIGNLNNITALEVWDVLLTSIAQAGSIGELLKVNIDDKITSRLASISYVPPDNATIADIKDVVDDTNLEVSFHDQYKADVSNLATSGAVATVNANVLAQNDITALDVWDVLEADIDNINTIGVKLKTNLDDAISNVLSAIAAQNDVSVAEIWDYLTSSITTPGSIGLQIKTNLDAQVSNVGGSTPSEIWDHLLTAITTSGSIGKLLKDNIELTKTTVVDTNTEVKNYANYKADVSGLALESSLQSLITDVSNLNDITAIDVWNALTADMNVNGSIGKLLKDNINESLTDIRSDIAGLNDITVAEIWNYLTGLIGTPGSIGKLIIDKFQEILDAIAAQGSSSPSEIWDYLLTSIVTSGSIGKLIKDNITADLSTLATESNATANKNAILTEISAQDGQIALIKNETDKIQTIDDNVDAIIPIVTDTNSEVKVYNNYKADVSGVATQTSLNDVSDQVTVVDGKIDTVQAKVNDTNTTVKQYNNYKADVSGLALESSVQSIITTLSAFNDLSASEVWDYLKTSVTVPGSIGKYFVDTLDGIVADIAAQNDITALDVWDVLMSQIDDTNSIGLFIRDKLNSIDIDVADTNAKISVPNDYKADVSLLALESSVQAVLVDTGNIETKVDNVQTDVTTIDGKVDNIQTDITTANTEIIDLNNLLIGYDRTLNTTTGLIELKEKGTGTVKYTIQVTEVGNIQDQVLTEI